eukprot:scaffold2246_cov162-Amphora_coffeaeformis.AAC.15
MSYYTTRLSVFLALWHVEQHSAFTLKRPTLPLHHIRILSTTQQHVLSKDQEEWIDAHAAHGLEEVQEPDADELLASEDLAAVDAHDALDAGMEAAAEERAVMMAAAMTHDMKFPPKQTTKQSPKQGQQWNEAHVAQGIDAVHEEDATELRESEELAMWDAHDAPDAGMEAAAEEWAVMLAAELTHQLKTNTKTTSQNNNNNKQKKDDWNEAHLAHGVTDLHEEDPDELWASEEAAAVDAHDAPDAGIEAAAEERAVMLAAELARTLKEKALQQKKEDK